MRIDLFGLLYDYSLYIVLCVAGIVVMMCASSINIYKNVRIPSNTEFIFKYLSKILILLRSVILRTPLKSVRKSIADNLEHFQGYDDNTDLKADGIMLLIILSGVSLCIILKDVSRLWYAKAIIAAICFFVPYYITMLLFELQKYSMNRKIPAMIDEFRSAFIKNRKIKPALLECSLYVDKRLGKLLVDAADSPYMIEKLKKIQQRLNNVWMSVFIISLIEYRDKGGELLEQLYKLTGTMAKSIGVEKKKNKRLILYEIFAVLAAVLSIPAVMQINNAIAGSYMTDAEMDMMISRVALSSLISLVVIRILRTF